MSMVAVKPPYTLILRDDDMAESPRNTDYCFGTMICWHRRYNLGDKHDYSEPEEFLREKLLSCCSAQPLYGNPIYDFIKSGKAQNARIEYNKSTHEWELSENHHWSPNSGWFTASSYPASLTGKDVPDYFLDECISALRLEEMAALIDRMNDIVLLPIFLYDHSGITMNTFGFQCAWDSGQVGWIYADKDSILSTLNGDMLTPELRDKAKNLLLGEVSYYNHFISGDCFGFQLYKDDEEISSCWGFIGDPDDLRDSIEGNLPDECKGIMNNLTYRYDDPDIVDILHEHEDEFCLEAG